MTTEELFDDRIVAPRSPEAICPHDFRLATDQETGERGFYCVECLQQQNKADQMCKGRA